MPTMEDYWKGIQMDELDMDLATLTEKKELEERKQGRVWRALRASVLDGRRFTLCEKIEDGKNLKALVGADEVEVDSAQTEMAEKEQENGEEGEERPTGMDGANEVQDQEERDQNGKQQGETPKMDEEAVEEAVGTPQAQADSHPTPDAGDEEPIAEAVIEVQEQTTAAEPADEDTYMDDFAPGGVDDLEEEQNAAPIATTAVLNNEPEEGEEAIEAVE